MPHFSLPQDGGLIPDSIPNDILHSYEKIPTEIFSEPADASEAVADLIVNEIKANGGKLRLGLSTGSSLSYSAQYALTSDLLAVPSGKWTFFS